MKNSGALISIFSFCLLATSAQAVTSAEGRLSARLQKDIENSGLKSEGVGVWVGFRGPQTKPGELSTVFAHNAERSYIPASTSKLVTLGAVLHELQPGYKFKTILASAPGAKIENGVLQGNIYFIGGGDPSFVSENMWFLVNELTRAGITSVKGDVVVDDTRFDSIRWGDDRQEERVDRAYDAPVGALSMNWNSVAVFVRPGEKAGEPAKVFADVDTPYIKVKNEAKTSSGHGKSISVERTDEKDFSGDLVVVRGSLGKDAGEQVVYKNITQPEIWAGYNLIAFMKQRGLTVTGGVHPGAAPKDGNLLATSESKPLSNVVAEMAKWSNNYVAEMLVKALAAEKTGGKGTTAAGIAEVNRYLVSAGLKAGSFDFVNAAGFTRKNHLSPRQIGQVLEFVKNDFTIYPEYLAAIPIAGVDGTLRHRMMKSAATNWVRAKTGLLTGVAALAGFAGRPDGDVLTFAFIYNGSGHEDKARALFDQMAAHLVEN